jgi:multiple sugar transport system substrate-binding protein
MFLGGAAMLGAAAAAGPLLAACGGTSSGGSGSGNSRGSGTILWSYWGEPAENTVNLQVKAAFEKDHPSIKVNTLWYPWTDYFNKIDSMLAGGLSPDVLFLTYIQKYAAEGAIDSLEPWVKNGGLNTNDYWPHFNDDMMYQGKLYGLQRDGDVDVLYYNPGHLQRAGVPTPDKSWTWDTLRSALTKLSIKQGGRVQRFGLAMEYGKWWLWLGMQGVKALDDMVNPSRSMFDDPRAITGFKWQEGLIKDQLMNPLLEQGADDQAAFSSQQASMIIQNPSRVPSFLQSGIQFGLAPVPKPVGGRYADNSGGAGYTIGARSKNKDAAWTFLSWLQSPGGQSIFAQTRGLFPALKQVATSRSYLTAPPTGMDALEFMAQYGEILSTGLFPEWAELDSSIIEPTLQKIWTGEQTTEQVAPQLAQQVDAYLKQRGYPKK